MTIDKKDWTKKLSDTEKKIFGLKNGAIQPRLADKDQIDFGFLLFSGLNQIYEECSNLIRDYEAEKGFANEVRTFFSNRAARNQRLKLLASPVTEAAGAAAAMIAFFDYVKRNFRADALSPDQKLGFSAKFIHYFDGNKNFTAIAQEFSILLSIRYQDLISSRKKQFRVVTGLGDIADFLTKAIYEKIINKPIGDQNSRENTVAELMSFCWESTVDSMKSKDCFSKISREIPVKVLSGDGSVEFLFHEGIKQEEDNNYFQYIDSRYRGVIPYKYRKEEAFHNVNKRIKNIEEFLSKHKKLLKAFVKSRENPETQASVLEKIFRDFEKIRPESLGFLESFHNVCNELEASQPKLANLSRSEVSLIQQKINSTAEKLSDIKKLVHYTMKDNEREPYLLAQLQDDENKLHSFFDKLRTNQETAAADGNALADSSVFSRWQVWAAIIASAGGGAVAGGTITAAVIFLCSSTTASLIAAAPVTGGASLLLIPVVAGATGTAVASVTAGTAAFLATREKKSLETQPDADLYFMSQIHQDSSSSSSNEEARQKIYLDISEDENLIYSIKNKSGEITAENQVIEKTELDLEPFINAIKSESLIVLQKIDTKDFFDILGKRGQIVESPYKLSNNPSSMFSLGSSSSNEPHMLNHAPVPRT